MTVPDSMLTPLPSGDDASAGGPVRATGAGDAALVIQQLISALADHGIRLPSLAADPVTLLACESPSSPYDAPLIDLGRCNLATARAIVRALQAGVSDAEG